MGFRFRKSKKFGAFRVNFSKSGVGFSVGSKGIHYTHSATGRKSIRATLPGTGIFYETSLSRKKNKYKKLNKKSEKVSTTIMGNNNAKKSNTKIAAVAAAGLIGLTGISALFGSEEQSDEITAADGLGREIVESVEPDENPETISTLSAVTEISEETSAPETEILSSEIVPQETEPKISPAETEPPVYTPTYIPEETTPPETDPPETEPPIVIVHDDSTMTVDMINELEGIAFFWAPTGNKVHLDPTCQSFKKGYTFAGTLEQAQSVRTDGWCGTCSKNAGSSTTTNKVSTKKILSECYSYSDFINGIPAEAFQ